MFAIFAVTVWCFSLRADGLLFAQPPRPPQLPMPFVSRTYCRHQFYVSYGVQSRTLIYLARNKQPAAETPANEFSRTYQVDRILKTKRGNSAATSSNAYSVSIEADAVECQALAQRFDLSSISSLSADLQLRPSLLSQGGVSSSTVEVEGCCKATVTQRCVRTNEDFDVHLEFPLFCIVRPVIPSSSQDGSAYQDSRNDKGGETSQQRKQSNSKNSFRLPDRNLNEMDVMELQRMLQLDMNTDDDVMMEDEAIYSLDRGLLDVGELVAQFFWFKLDPYPKKPGTDPVQISITG
jgi:hypothetical protein